MNMEIVGYYPSWAAYKYKGAFLPSLMSFKPFTTVIYAFFEPLESGDIRGIDQWADEIILLGKRNWVVPDERISYYEQTSLIDCARRDGAKVLISIGGWNHSNAFPLIAADPEKRKRFAKSCLALVKQYHLDGIDIDWEYPGFEEHQGTSADFKNFIALIEEIREALSAHESSKILTCALFPDKSFLAEVDFVALSKIVNWFHLFTFDFAAGDIKKACHNAALYFNPESPLKLNIISLINYIQDQGLPANQLVMGLPYFGRGFEFKQGGRNLFDDTVLNQEFAESTYAEIQLLQGAHYWDQVSKAPYMINRQKALFLTYDDPKSIAFKFDYAVQKNLKGLFVWEMTGDKIPGKPAELTEVLKDSIKLLQK